MDPFFRMHPDQFVPHIDIDKLPALIELFVAIFWQALNIFLSWWFVINAGESLSWWLWREYVSRSYQSRPKHFRPRWETFDYWLLAVNFYGTIATSLVIWWLHELDYVEASWLVAMIIAAVEYALLLVLMMQHWRSRKDPFEKVWQDRRALLRGHGVNTLEQQLYKYLFSLSKDLDEEAKLTLAIERGEEMLQFIDPDGQQEELKRAIEIYRMSRDVPEPHDWNQRDRAERRSWHKEDDLPNKLDFEDDYYDEDEDDLLTDDDAGSPTEISKVTSFSRDLAGVDARAEDEADGVPLTRQRAPNRPKIRNLSVIKEDE